MTWIERMNGNKAFNHHVPSCFMAARIGELQFIEEALNTFEEIFKAIKKLLKLYAKVPSKRAKNYISFGA